MAEVSIVIPTFNCEKYIHQTLDSVIKQTFADFEIIVVDDGSTDKTTQIIKNYNYPVRLIVQNNAGVCIARNRGLEESKGRYVCFMDHDDYWYPEKLECQLKVFNEHPEAGVVHSTFINWQSDSDGNFPPPDSFSREDIPDEIDSNYSGWVYHLYLLDSWMLTSTAMIKKEVLRKCGGFDPSLPFSEDWDLWLRITREYPIIRTARPTTLYRQHRDQGNRLVRDIDYRTRLLVDAVKKWGFSSRDGRSIDKRVFLDQLAIYHTIFALNHLRGGKFNIALSSFFKAWRCCPLNLKYLAYIPAALLGWRPK
jgi:glycosyltransferase involved in cell wall biosynthesis